MLRFQAKHWKFANTIHPNTAELSKKFSEQKRGFGGK